MISIRYLVYCTASRRETGYENSSSRLVWFYQFTRFSLYSLHRYFLIFMSSTFSLATSVDYSTSPFPYPLLPWLPCSNRVFESSHSYSCPTSHLSFPILFYMPHRHKARACTLWIYCFTVFHYARYFAHAIARIVQKVNVIRKVHPRTGHEGPEGEYRYSSTLSLTSALDGVGGQRHAPATLSPGKTRYPLYRRLGAPQNRLDGCGKSRPPTAPPQRDSIPDCPARSAYRLRYPGSLARIVYTDVIYMWDRHLVIT